jgi:predicted acetyltransferase
MALAGVKAPRGTSLRPAAEIDVPRLRELYRMTAQSATGMMERSGPLFPTTDAELLAGYDGVTVAVGTNGDLEGYATWNRGPGYDTESQLAVDDLVALTPGATSALLSGIASWASVAPTALLRLPDPDPAWLMLASIQSSVHSRQPWMLRVVDAAGAVAARGWPAQLSGSVDLELEDGECPWNAGPHRLVLSAGQGRLEPGGNGRLRLSARGFAALYAGSAHPAVLRRAGLLSGGDSADAAFLQAATAGPAPNLLDYF